MQRLADIEPSHVHVVAGLLLQHHRDLRQRIASLQDPQLAEVHGVDEFSRTWGRMMAQEVEGTLTLDCPGCIWVPPQPATPVAVAVGAGRASLLPAGLHDLLPRILVHLTAPTARLRRRLHRLHLKVTRPWRLSCAVQGARHMWRGLTDARWVTAVASGLEDAEDAEHFLGRVLTGLLPASRLQRCVAGVARTMGVPMPAVVLDVQLEGARARYLNAAGFDVRHVERQGRPLVFKPGVRLLASMGDPPCVAEAGP